jgi:site-specific DNA-methyltransferase (adenine-specific)
MVMKSLNQKSFVDQALKNGKGVTWLHDCRIPYKDESDFEYTSKKSNSPSTHTEMIYDGGWKDRPTEHTNPQGRFPANLLVSSYIDCDYSDSGSYSRYFSLDKWFDTTFPFLAIPKASTSEKNKGLDKWISKVNDGRQTPIDNPFQRGETVRKNIHPAVKPLKLMAWLVTLLSRPNDIILDPFMGSGTTCIAAKLLKRNYIGIEKELEYLEIARQRINSY